MWLWSQGHYRLYQIIFCHSRWYVSQFLHNNTYRVVIGEIMSMLLDRLCSCMAVLANVCLVQNTWMTTDFRCAEIAKRLLSGAVGHMIIIVVSNPNCLFSPPSMWVGLVTSCSNCSRSRYLGFKYQRMQILPINFKILMVSLSWLVFSTFRSITDTCSARSLYCSSSSSRQLAGCQCSQI